MEMLRPGEVKPQGWLRDRCLAAKAGYVSRMDEVDKAFPRAWSGDFHPRGKYLDWTDADKGAWCAEGGAYWFEGLVRLAWELDDPELKDLAKRRLAPLLECMHPNALGLVYWMDRRDPAQLDERDLRRGERVGVPVSAAVRPDDDRPVVDAVHRLDRPVPRLRRNRHRLGKSRQDADGGE